MNLRKLRFPIKTKLTVATLIPLGVAILICWMAGVFILSAKVATQAQEKVRYDLNVAREAYQNELTRLYDVVKFTAAFGKTGETLVSGNREAVADILTPVRSNEHLDLLGAVDASGKVIYRASNPEWAGDDKGRNQFVARALRGEIVSGTTVLPAAELALEGDALLHQAKVPAPVPGAKGEPPASVPSAGMFLFVAAPVRDRAGNVLGALYGGILLNNSRFFVEKIKSVVYEGARLHGNDIGTTTLYLGDQMIATTLPLHGRERLADMKLTRQVNGKVLLAKTRWVGRSYVGNDWYLSAYEPILSLQGVPIGALAVGMLESQYSAVKIDMAVLLSFVLLVSCLVGVSMAGFLGKKLAHPIKELELLTRRVAAGERNVQSHIESRDEIGDLAERFNVMSRSLAEREDSIIELNRNLEEKVKLRTAELEENNRLLLQTREELLRVEKLAAIGELAAGVAHEINNPMAIIRGNVELLQITVPEDAENREEVDTIFQQVKRVERIVSNLQKFARKQKRENAPVHINELLHEIVAQIRHQVPLDGIKVVENYSRAVEVVAGDGDQLRQVFTNLVLNGVQAMPQGGVLSLKTAPVTDTELYEVQVADTGVGIQPENLSQVFNPFFTTKPSGTGLGLSVSYGIVREHGGTIDIQSIPGSGTTFSVVLPREA
ncbi:two-component sensor histidine kinase [Geomonas silvestris]|uniref:histidine kinase n=1 Tax=Geomonas silvestris TaxID=2740184 RepID=A0A6V8MCH2_9BACT|nr:ATP-binding protein [Geomonas silvestris]GFO57691.1 two-component sensor histidine kinase [Geomonas silvestris]